MAELTNSIAMTRKIMMRITHHSSAESGRNRQTITVMRPSTHCKAMLESLRMPLITPLSA